MNPSFLERWLPTVPDDLFYQPRAPLWLPDEIAMPPMFDVARGGIYGN
jgi:hypothetical protein